MSKEELKAQFLAAERKKQDDFLREQKAKGSTLKKDKSVKQSKTLSASSDASTLAAQETARCSAESFEGKICTVIEPILEPTEWDPDGFLFPLQMGEEVQVMYVPEENDEDNQGWVVGAKPGMPGQEKREGWIPTTHIIVKRPA